MFFIKRVGIILAIAVVLFAISASFLVISIADRAIIIGLGLDYDGEMITVTCEVLTGSQSSSENGGSGEFSKTMTGRGETVSLAIHDIYVKSGQLPSLGQCCIVLLGQSIYPNMQLAKFLEHFLFSDAFKDNTIIACYEGKAQDAFGYITTLTPSPSFAIAQLLQGSDGRTGLPQNHLEKFMSKQFKNLSKCSFLNVVKFLPDSQINDAQTKKTQGDFHSDSIAIFKDYQYRGELSGLSLEGFNLLMGKSTFGAYTVKDDIIEGISAEEITVGLVSKDVKQSVTIEKDNVVLKIGCDVRVDRLRTDETGKLFILQNHKDDKINLEMEKQIKEQITKQIESAYATSVALGCDYLELSNQLYRSYGSTYALMLDVNPTLPFSAELVIEVQVQQ